MPHWTRPLRHVALLGAALALAGCSAAPHAAVPPPVAFAPTMVFPADASLDRAEAGVALPDGRLVVSDRTHGLRLVERDGSSRPFGRLRACGYRNEPPGHEAAANGVTLEPDRAHVLVADVLGGGIYRVALADGDTELVHQHPFGVNSARRDSTGAIWFTQSTECTAETGEARSFAAVDVPIADGSVWRLGFAHGRFASSPVRVRDGLRYANGIEIDERRGMLYVSECCADRVLQAPVDLATGTVGTWSTLAELDTPDNLEIDARGRLWVASPIGNAVGVVDLETGAFHPVLRVQTPAQAALASEFRRRGRAGASRLDLLVPDLWAPLPGLVTGVIHGPGPDDVWVTGLGNALIRLHAE